MPNLNHISWVLLFYFVILITHFVLLFLRLEANYAINQLIYNTAI